MNRFNAFLMRKFYLIVLLLLTIQSYLGFNLLFTGISYVRTKQNYALSDEVAAPAFPFPSLIPFLFLTACLFYLLLIRRSMDIKEGRYKL
ncbi:hypothetical protein C6Y45_08315 [Alkalicoccus saliphilus]|jgi:hypothetical protein|uniref:Uncharacterized protein n=1 Tax=Alkalicoccus saliphilus TaxID=200989 RepID=A0A2T4U6I2_9BACI|nr:hypothetical protein C6Y45_08315 [Alkalicoccus saliphilus]